jgi:hypothetical protein
MNCKFNEIWTERRGIVTFSLYWERKIEFLA